MISSSNPDSEVCGIKVKNFLWPNTWPVAIQKWSNRGSLLYFSIHMYSPMQHHPLSKDKFELRILDTLWTSKASHLFAKQDCRLYNSKRLQFFIKPSQTLLPSSQFFHHFFAMNHSNVKVASDFEQTAAPYVFKVKVYERYIWIAFSRSNVGHI